jgi:hypothetical protein
LEEAGHDQRHHPERLEPGGQRDESQATDDGRCRQQRLRVTEVLVLDEEEHDQWRQGGQWEPESPADRYDEPGHEEHRPQEANLLAEVQRVVCKSGDAQGIGMALLGSLTE